MHHSTTTFIKFFKDRDGHIVLWQTPNVPLVGWVLFIVSTHILHTASWQQFASYMSFGFIFTWAWLEMTGGASYFRRALGLIVLVVSIYTRIK